MSDLRTTVSRLAARQAGHASADRLRIRAKLDDLAELEDAVGETFGGGALRLAYAVAELRRECWRRLARQPVYALHPAGALAIIRAAWRRR